MGTMYEKIVLETPAGADATVYLHGAHLASCKTACGTEFIFMSREAVFNGEKALRGGVPVCFPQFSDVGPVKHSHGFARNTKFEVAEGDEDPLGINDKCESAKLVLRSSEATLAMWPHPFQYFITFTLLDEGVKIDVEVVNPSEEAIEFTTALHTYFRVQDITQTSVAGLYGIDYLDNAQGRVQSRDVDEAVVFPGEVDRIYLNTPDSLKIVDEAAESSIIITKSGSWFDAVVWNPWIGKAKATKDLGDDEYTSFVCVEVARIGSPVLIAPQASWQAAVEYQVLEKPTASM